MSRLSAADRAAIENRMGDLHERYEAFKARRLALDMTRGKPCPEQLDLSLGMLTCLGADHKAADGTDCRNYGGLDGLAEAKALFSKIIDVAADEIIVGGASSLNMMHDTVLRAMTHGVPGGAQPWGKLPAVKFLCPSPGYDRHFSICRHFGIEMIVVDMKSDGPDMDAVERLAAADESIKGIWCVPKYSNPTGVTFSDEVVERFARMKSAAADFRIFWDNAYAVHHLGTPDRLKNILEECKRAGRPDRVYVFGSTSKISFAGAGVAMMGASKANLADTRKHLAIQTIGPDKLNQLRHVRFFKDLTGIEAQMSKHAAILRPKFDAVIEILARELSGLTVAQWSRPNGGYFVSLDTLDGCAKAVVARAAEAGVKFTEAGATFPLGRDPRDRNIRIAPSLPGAQAIAQATELLAICIQLVSLEKT